jgi:hypothetical protein
MSTPESVSDKLADDNYIRFVHRQIMKGVVEHDEVSDWYTEMHLHAIEKYGRVDIQDMDSALIKDAFKYGQEVARGEA